MDKKPESRFWNAALEDLTRGYTEGDNEYFCLICDETFEKGRIYEINKKLYDAKKAVEFHIEEEHNSVLQYYIGMNNAFTGITQVQGDVIELMAQGLSDKGIAKKLGVADSTVRNHRFKLREKEKQAKIFLAIMDLLSNQVNGAEKEAVLDLHRTATAIDERYNITEKETEDTIKKYFDENGALKNFPSREKRKIIVLREIMKNFSKGKKYKEPELNRIIGRIHEDFSTIRRYLIEYGFLDRTNDGTSYWVKE